MSTKVAFTGWNSLQSGWNTSTWNTSLPFSLTATGSVGLAAPEGDAIVAVTGVAGTAALGSYFTTNTMSTSTGAVGSATIKGKANVSVTGVAGTSALGNIFSTNVGISATASVNGATTATVGKANVTVTGVNCTAVVGNLANPPWGQIIPDQNPRFLNIAPSQDPSWANIENGFAA